MKKTITPHSIIGRVILLFLVLITVVIASALFSTFQQNKNSKYIRTEKLKNAHLVAQSISDNEIEKLKIISGIIRERNSTFAQYLDYDKLRPIQIIFQSVSSAYEIDLIFLFDENNELLVTNSIDTSVDKITIPISFLGGEMKELVGIETIPTEMAQSMLPEKNFDNSNADLLCFKSIITLHHDVGDILGQVVLVKIINNNSTLAENISQTADAQIIVYQNNNTVALTNFETTDLPFPSDNFMQVGDVGYFTHTSAIQNSLDNNIGFLTVALDSTIFIKNRYRRIILDALPFLATVIISIALFFILKVKVLNKIRQLADVLRQVTEDEGKLHLRMPIKTKEKGTESLDEVETIAHDFNHMMGTLEKTYSQLQDSHKSLEETSGYLSTILLNMADGLLATDPDGIITLFNPALVELFGLEYSELKGKSCNSLFADQMVDLLEQIKKTPNDTITAELNLFDDKIGQAAASAIFRSNNHIGSVVIVRDISDEKRVDQMKTDFISTVSHELRTPLTSVVGFAKMIRKKFDKSLLPALSTEDDKVQKNTRQVRSNLDIIILEGERLTNLINDVLDIAKMEAGKVVWDMQENDIKEIIDRAVNASSSLFAQKKLDLTVDIAPDIPTFTCDRDRLLQVIINLLSNAVKFTEQGQVQCNASMNDRDVLIQVVDSGTGIPESDFENVFEKFKQSGDTLTDKPKGTGLGLPICKQIVEHHGGRIWVESVLNKGSTFSFAIPINPIKAG